MLWAGRAGRRSLSLAASAQVRKRRAAAWRRGMDVGFGEVRLLRARRPDDDSRRGLWQLASRPPMTTGAARPMTHALLRVQLAHPSACLAHSYSQRRRVFRCNRRRPSTKSTPPSLRAAAALTAKLGMPTSPIARPRTPPRWPPGTSASAKIATWPCCCRPGNLARPSRTGREAYASPAVPGPLKTASRSANPKAGGPSPAPTGPRRSPIRIARVDFARPPA